MQRRSISPVALILPGLLLASSLTGPALAQPADGPATNSPPYDVRPVVVTPLPEPPPAAAFWRY